MVRRCARATCGCTERMFRRVAVPEAAGWSGSRVVGAGVVGQPGWSGSRVVGQPGRRGGRVAGDPRSGEAGPVSTAQEPVIDARRLLPAGQRHPDRHRRPGRADRRHQRAVPAAAAATGDGRGGAALVVPGRLLAAAGAHRRLRHHAGLRRPGHRGPGGGPGARHPPPGARHRPGHRRALLGRRPGPAALGARHRGELVRGRGAAAEPDRRRPSEDRFLAEQVRAGALLGGTDLPASRAEVDAYFAAVRPELQASPLARRAVRRLALAPLPRRLELPGRPVWTAVAAVAIGLLPSWAKQLYGLPQHPGHRLGRRSGR